MKLTGKRRDGSTFHCLVTARTSRVRLYKEKDVASLELSGIDAAATALEIFETGQEPIDLKGLEALAKVATLTNLSLGASANVDLAPLGSCPALRHLSLNVHGRHELDLGWLRGIGSLESLSVWCTGGPTHVSLDALRDLPRLRSVGLAGLANARVDLPGEIEHLNVTGCDALEALPLGGRLHTLHVMRCPRLEKLDLAPLAAAPIERIYMLDVGLTSLDLFPLAGAKALVSVTLLRHAIRCVDLTPLLGVASLRSLEVDGKDAPFADVKRFPIRSPVLKAWNAAGALQTEP